MNKSEPKPFNNPDYCRTISEDGKRKFVATSRYANFISSNKNIINFQCGCAPEAGDTIEINDIVATVVSARCAKTYFCLVNKRWVSEYGRFNWVLEIECDQMDLLRDALMYKAGRSSPKPGFYNNIVPDHIKQGLGSVSYGVQRDDFGIPKIEYRGCLVK